jgi:1-acyl-sn-glycerol-3-phosphate acyltransferase
VLAACALAIGFAKAVTARRPRTRYTIGRDAAVIIRLTRVQSARRRHRHQPAPPLPEGSHRLTRGGQHAGRGWHGSRITSMTGARPACTVNRSGGPVSQARSGRGGRLPRACDHGGLMDASWRVPWVWRALLRFSRVLVPMICRLQVSGEVPDALRHGPLILAANHVSPVDPVVMTAACSIAGVAPRFMATGGLFDAPIAGWAMRAAGHLRVDRHTAQVAQALPDAADALRAGSVVLVYPEGRIGLDPWMWPERGKTGVARMASLSGAPVIPVAQWDTHRVLPYAAPVGIVGSVLRAMWHRPVVQVRFGEPVDLSGLTGTAGAQAMRATDRIVEGIARTLEQLREDEPREPHFVDRTRPVDMARVRRRPLTGEAGTALPHPRRER